MGPELVVSSPQPVKVPLTVLLLWVPAFPTVSAGALHPIHSFQSHLRPFPVSSVACRPIYTWQLTRLSVSWKRCCQLQKGTVTATRTEGAFLLLGVHRSPAPQTAGVEPASVLHHFSVGSLQWLNGLVRVCFRTQPSRTEYRCPGAGPRMSPQCLSGQGQCPFVPLCAGACREVSPQGVSAVSQGVPAWPEGAGCSRWVVAWPC